MRNYWPLQTYVDFKKAVSVLIYKDGLEVRVCSCTFCARESPASSPPMGTAAQPHDKQPEGTVPFSDKTAERGNQR